MSNTSNFKDLDKDKRIKKELSKLKNIYKNLDKNTQKVTEKLINNASFLAIVLEELQEHIRINGVKEQYKNGKDQYGYKQSVEADLYNKYLKNYMGIIKQLTDLLHKEIAAKDDDDGFMDFINSR